jgi:hypothetical protein
MKKALTTTALAVLLTGGTLALSVGRASADVVCNNEGDCWHVHEHYAFPPRVGVIIHGDDWRWGDRDHFRWHEHEGRGYWRGGVWIGF